MSDPQRLAVLPLRDVVLFPHVVMPLLVGRSASLAAVAASVNDGGLLFLVAQRDPDVQEPAAGDLHRVGVTARILQAVALPNGTTRVLVEATGRARVTRYGTAGGHLRAVIEPLEPEPGVDDEASARRALTLFEEYVALQRRIPAEVVAMIQGADSITRQAFGIAAHLAVRLDVRQRLLETRSVADLLRQLRESLAAEIELLRLERKIEDDVRGSLFQNQREFYLQEQLKAIHRELGQDEGEEEESLERQVEARNMPEPVRARALRELRKLRRTPSVSPESTVSRNYLDWLVSLPWSDRSEDVRDLALAKQVLDEDHAGLDEVKDRVLDYLGALALTGGKLEGPILCLAGPPGVGKTSLGRSIARALGRKFVRMSLGGVRDEAEIRGHRRTYVGAMPGRVIQAMRRAEVVNPVILLDEIDKLGQDFRGDPAAALLEVLDPEQNRAFNDHYLEVDYDLSQVLFVTTANYLPQVPEPLRDRMEVIRLSGYLDQEKFAIARRFLVPKQLRQHGVDPEAVTWGDDAIPAIVHGYTREAGVRELERRIARVARKLARARAERAPGPASGDGGPGTGTSELRPGDGGPGTGTADTEIDADSIRNAPDPGPRSPDRVSAPDSGPRSPDHTDHITAADLPALLGTPPFDPSGTALEDTVGVATGLAYTSVGGEVLEIEVSVLPGRGKIQLTGTLGAVMKESASAALSYVRHRTTALGIDRAFHRTRDLHVHIPAGATPKDGPSAGIAICTALVSALTGVAVRGDVAMTGEVTLRGRVLPIGGLREKAVAAHRNRMHTVIIPFDNQRDLDEIPAEVRAGVRFVPVKTMDEVLEIALARPVLEDGATTASAVAQSVTH